MAAWEHFWLSGQWSSDTVAPIPNITVNPNRSKISRVAGVDSTTFSWTVNENFQAYQLRVVSAATDPVSAGTLIESGGGGTSGTTYSSTITDDELIAASAADGAKLVKLFVQDSAGNWSSAS